MPCPWCLPSTRCAALACFCSCLRTVGRTYECPHRHAEQLKERTIPPLGENVSESMSVPTSMLGIEGARDPLAEGTPAVSISESSRTKWGGKVECRGRCWRSWR